MGAAIPVPSNGSRAYVNFSPQVVTRMDRAVRYGRFDLLHVHEALHAERGDGRRPPRGVSGGRHVPCRPRRLRPVRQLGVAGERGDAPRRRARRRAGAARAFPQSRYPGPYRIIPNGIPVEKYAAAVGAPRVEGRILFIGRAVSAGRARHTAPGVHAPARARAARDAGHRRRHPPAGARDRSQRSVDLTVDMSGIEPLGWVDDGERRWRSSRRPKWSARRRWPPRASASCWPRRWPPAPRWSPPTCRATARYCVTGRPGG